MFKNNDAISLKNNYKKKTIYEIDRLKTNYVKKRLMFIKKKIRVVGKYESKLL